jgi:hypothetical protein
MMGGNKLGGRTLRLADPSASGCSPRNEAHDKTGLVEVKRDPVNTLQIRYSCESVLAVDDDSRWRWTRPATDRLRLVAGRVCVVARSHGVEDELHRVTLPGGVPA